MSSFPATLFYLRLSTLCIVLKDDECGLAIYEQLKALYQLICHPYLWNWNGIENRIGVNQKVYSLMVVFSRNSLHEIDEEHVMTVTVDNYYVVYKGYIPYFNMSDTNILDATCYLCKWLPQRYYYKKASFTSATNSRTVIFINMKYIVTNVKVEIAECLETFLELYSYTHGNTATAPPKPIRDVIISKTWSEESNTKTCRVTFDGDVVFYGAQPYRKFRIRKSVNCFCTL
jgi:hypothetical protein